MTSRRQYGNNPAVQKRPRRFTVQHQHRISVPGAVFHPGHAQGTAFLVGDLAIAWGIRKFRQIGEMLVRRAQYLHGWRAYRWANDPKPRCALIVGPFDGPQPTNS